MPSRRNLYDLYGPTSLISLERRIAEGKIPTADELAAVLEVNSAEPLPAWFSALVVASLRGELKKKRGRPPNDDALSDIRFQLARGKYPRYLAWLQKRDRSVGLKGWPALRGQHWWKGPPHERAARMATARWLRHVDWKTFLNRVSSS
jgi:hypothetical protein